MPQGNTIRVTYKVDGQEFFIFADQEYLTKWRKDKTIPLVQVAECKSIVSLDWINKADN